MIPSDKMRCKIHALSKEKRLRRVGEKEKCSRFVIFHTINFWLMEFIIIKFKNLILNLNFILPFSSDSYAFFIQSISKPETGHRQILNYTFRISRVLFELCNFLNRLNADVGQIVNRLF